MRTKKSAKVKRFLQNTFCDTCMSSIILNNSLLTFTLCDGGQCFIRRFLVLLRKKLEQIQTLLSDN